MEFFSQVTKLIAGSPSTANKRSSVNNLDKRLGRLRREYKHLLQIWQNATNLSRDQDAMEEVRRAVQELTTILKDESRRPSPHVCISYASAERIYIGVGKIATTSYNEPIVREAVAFFSTLIESEEEDFLENQAFSESLMRLVIRITGPKRIPLGPETEVEIVELALRIATKIRLQPEILPVWFTTNTEDVSDKTLDAHEKFAGKTLKNDFPLFYLLIDQIHEDGRIGEFARTGLLYIIESASTSMALEQWLVESDLATVMASGLQALYSRIRVKLVIDYPPDELPLILTLSDYQRPLPTSDIFSSTDSDYLDDMDTFLSYLAFWQDVLDHCKSTEVKQTLLEHFKVIVLQQVLYPSLLQSSDIDGGSSVAVLTSLRRILESLNHPDMIHLILHYLLALPDTAPSPTKAPVSRMVSAARRQKSMDLANMMALQSEEAANPMLFNLVDLILVCLRSGIPQSIAVTLQLVSVILRRHHRYAVSTLLRTARSMTDGPQTTIGAHEREMNFLLSLAGEIGGDEGFDEAYEKYVRDCMVLLESHPCSQTLIFPKNAKETFKLPGAQASIPGGPRDVKAHTLRTDDPLLKTIVGLFETFFINPVETNLSLTAVIIDLATCGYMSIEGWLLPDPAKFIHDDMDDLGDLSLNESGTESKKSHESSKLHAIKQARRTPHWPPTELPALLVTLQKLISHISIYRTGIPRFDDLLQQRRSAVHTQPSQETPKAVNQKQRSSFDSSPSRSGSPPAVKQSTFNSLAQQIFPGFASPSRSSSPRGRRSQDQPRNTISQGMGTPGPALAQSPSTPRFPPPQFPMSSPHDTPSRGSSRAFSSSPLRASEITPSAPKGQASQVAAFAEVDKAILARKVGIPTTKGKLVPPPFPNLASEARVQESAIVEGEEPIKPKGVSGEDESPSTESDHFNDAQEEPAVQDLVKEDVTEGEEPAKLVTVSHVLTNVIVLQEFLLELAALIQVRAGLFGEVKFM